MNVFNRFSKKWLAMVMACVFFCHLSVPAIVYGKEVAVQKVEKERLDKRLLTQIGNRIEVILRSICEKVSASEDNDITVKTFLLDKKHRVFADINGTVTIRYPSVMKKSVEKLKSAVGKCLSTNGPFAMDFSVCELTEVDEKTFKLSFTADIVITLKEVFRSMFVECLNLFGSITIGSSVSKATDFFDSVNADRLSIAIGDGLKTLWALGAGKIAIDSYQMLDATGHLSLKKVLVTTFTVKSVVYHFGAFILRAGIKAGASFTKLSLGAAIGTALAGHVGAFIGAALAAAAIAILGEIVARKITVDMPMAYRMRKIRKLKNSLEFVAQGSSEENEILTRIDTTEDAAVAFLKNEILLDRYSTFGTFIKKMKNAYEDGDLEYYDGLLTKVKGQLQTSIVHDENWNAARYYYQLLTAVGQLPPTGTEETASQ